MNRFVASVALVAVLAFPPGVTIAATGDCGQPQSTGSGPKTADALATLKTAVGSPSACDAEPCICDVNADTKVNTTDALRVLRVAVGQSLTLDCDCGPAECVTLGSSAALSSNGASARGVAAVPAQIMIEAKIVGIDQDSFDDLGLSFDLEAIVSTTTALPNGGTSGHEGNLAVESEALGGPAGLQYFLYGAHPSASCLPVLNKNFQSPFDAVKTFFVLPTDGCVLFDVGVTSAPQNFPGGNPVQNLAPADAGYDDAMVHYSLLGDGPAASLLESIGNDNRNTVLSPLDTTTYSGQAVLHMVDDIEPSIGQIMTDFRNNIQAVTPSPFGNFTGPTIDFVPRIEIPGHVTLDIYLGTQFASFFFSTAFLVDGTAVDAEIPLHRRSLNGTSINVPTGQTLVLGGMLRDGQQVADKGLPLLGDLPLIGSLFTRKHLDATRQNLLVFIKPTVIDDGE